LASYRAYEERGVFQKSQVKKTQFVLPPMVYQYSNGCQFRQPRHPGIILSLHGLANIRPPRFRGLPVTPRHVQAAFGLAHAISPAHSLRSCKLLIELPVRSLEALHPQNPETPDSGDHLRSLLSIERLSYLPSGLQLYI
jgi:hypothetical protein